MSFANSPSYSLVYKWFSPMKPSAKFLPSKSRGSQFLPSTQERFRNKQRVVGRRLAMTASSPASAPPPPAVAAFTTPALLTDFLPISILTDSYKASHFLQYPADALKMVAVSCQSVYLAYILIPHPNFKIKFKSNPIQFIFLNAICSMESSVQGTTETHRTHVSYGTACVTFWSTT